jgi:hypothetical protein
MIYNHCNSISRVILPRLPWIRYPSEFSYVEMLQWFICALADSFVIVKISTIISALLLGAYKLSSDIKKCQQRGTRRRRREMAEGRRRPPSLPWWGRCTGKGGWGGARQGDRGEEGGGGRGEEDLWFGERGWRLMGCRWCNFVFDVTPITGSRQRNVYSKNTANAIY